MIRFLAAVLPVLAVASSLGAQVVVASSTFDTGVTGWVGGPGPTWVSSGGPGGTGDGFLFTGPGGSQSHMAVVSADSNGAFHFDYAAQGVYGVEVDLMNPSTSTGPVSVRVVLFGPNDAATHRWTSVEAATVPADNVWRRFLFLFSPEALVRVQGSATHAQTLGDVRAVMFRHDPGTPNAGGTSATGLNLAVDNIRLVAVPEPATVGALALGLVAFLSLRARRR